MLAQKLDVGEAITTNLLPHFPHALQSAEHAAAPQQLPTNPMICATGEYG